MATDQFILGPDDRRDPPQLYSLQCPRCSWGWLTEKEPRAGDTICCPNCRKVWVENEGEEDLDVLDEHLAATKRTAKRTAENAERAVRAANTVRDKLWLSAVGEVCGLDQLIQVLQKLQIEEEFSELSD